MQKYPHIKNLSYLGATLVGLLLANSSWADTAKIQWNGNSHYYQRFDQRNITWASAKYKCETLNGHLATITSESEQGFTATNVVDSSQSSSDGYIIGGKIASGQWQWVTGESWSYTNSDIDFGVNTTFAKLQNDGVWIGNNFNYINGYICEWSYKNFLSSAVVPDINKNGAPEFAALYQGTKNNAHLVEIKDSATSKLLGKLTFPAEIESSLGMVALKNIETSNKTPELGVLIYTGTATYSWSNLN